MLLWIFSLVCVYDVLFLTKVEGVAITFGANKFSSIFLGNHHLNRTTDCNQKCLNQEFNTSFCVGNDPVQLTNSRSEGLLLPLNALTIETWVRINNSIVNSSFNFLSMYSGMSEKLNEPQTGFRLGFHENFPVFGVALTPDLPSKNRNITYTHANKAVSGPPLSFWRADRWYHIAGVWDGKYKRLYIDGELMESHEVKDAQGGIWYGDSKLQIGGTLDCSSTVYFAGALSEIRLWDTGRTHEEINEWKDKLVLKNSSNLIGLWREMSFGTIFDETGNQPPGISSGIVVNDISVPFPPLPPSPSSWTEKWKEVERCVKPPTNICGSFISYSVYDLHPIADYSFGIAKFTSFLALSSAECRTPITRHLCMQYFPRCAKKQTKWRPNWDGVNTSILPVPTYVFNMTVPLPPCEDVCLNVLKSCKTEVRLAQSLQLEYLMYEVVFGSGVVYQGDSCINVTKDNFHSFPFPNSSSTSEEAKKLVVYPSVNDKVHAFGGFQFDFSCTKDYANVSIAGNAVVPCVYPTVPRKGSTDDSLVNTVATYISSNSTDLSSFLESPSCVIRCPPPVFSLSAYSDLTWMSSIVSLCAFLITLACSVYLLTQAPQRRFPGLLLTCVVISVCGLSLGFLLSWFGNYTDYLCSNDLNNDAKQGDNALCDTQAVFIQFFGLNVVLYWGIMTFYLWRVFKMRVPKAEHGIVFIVSPACVSVISVIVLASTSSFGLSITGNMCWIQAEALTLSWICFYVPVLLVGLFNIFVLFSYAFTKIDFSVTDAAFSRMLKMAIVLLLVFACSLASQLHISVQYETYLMNQERVFQCHMFGSAYDILIISGRSPVSEGVKKVRQGGRFELLQTGYVNYDSCPIFESGFNDTFLFFDQFLFHSLGIWVVIIFYSGLIQRAVTSSFHRMTSTAGGGGGDSSHSDSSTKGSRNVTVTNSHSKKKKHSHHHSSSHGGSMRGSTLTGSVHKSLPSVELSSDQKLRAMAANEFM